MGARALALRDQAQADVVWLALAVSQWPTGRTVETVRSHPIDVIDNAQTY